MTQQPLAERALAVVGIDRPLPPARVALTRLALATVVALGGSIAADAVLVAVGTAVFPATRGFSHFRLSDYGVLTVIGVLIACLGWPAAVYVSSTPRRLYRRAAVLVTFALWVPDLWILKQGEPPHAVAVLMVMHVAIALVTYQAVVNLVPPLRRDGAAESGGDGSYVPGAVMEGRAVWVVMVGLCALEAAAGLAALFAVPYTHRNGLLPGRGKDVYLVHGAIGVALFVAALSVLVVSLPSGRVHRGAAIAGALGVGLGITGGVLAAAAVGRLAGMALMFVGVVVAGFAYLMPLVESPGSEAPGGEASGSEAHGGSVSGTVL